MEATVRGGDVVARNILVFTKGFLKQVNADLGRVEKVLKRKVSDNISLTDHSLEDLRALGHPYATRAPQAIHSPGYQVHKQSGKMKRGLFSGVAPAEVVAGRLTASAYVGINQDVEHAAMVIYGTSKMVPRDFLRGSVQEIKGEAIQILGNSLKNAVVSFAGERTQL